MVRRATTLTILALALPAPAGAATLSLQYRETVPAAHGAPAFDLYAVRVVGVGDDADAVTVDAKGRVRDDGPGLTAGAGCTVDADGWGHCTAPDRGDHATTLTFEIATGADDDSVSADEAPPLTVDLGPGDDRGSFTSAYATVDGGPGADRVTSVEPLPRAGGYVVFDGGAGPDAGSGNALVMSYGRRSAGVRVTPDGVADDGEPGEGDDVGADVARIDGGRGPDELWSNGRAVDGGPEDDHIIGVDAPTGSGGGALRGGAGNDVIDGRNANEALSGGAGDDVLRGGGGDDGLDPGTGRDRSDGGPGDDSAVDANADGVPDDWRGGPGVDTWDGTDIASHRVRVSLDGRADDGPPRERDDVHADWERVSIARGTLVGSRHADRLAITLRGTLRGGGGDDVLLGGDDVTGGPGRDRLSPFPGARVDVRDGERDVVTCAGRLRAVRRDRLDRLRGRRC